MKKQVVNCFIGVPPLWCRIFSYCLLSFPQNERKIYKLRPTQLSQRVYFSLVLREREDTKTKHSASVRSLATRNSNGLRLCIWTNFEKMDTVRRRNSVIIMWRDICWLQLPNFDIVTAKRWRQRRTFYAFHNFQRGCEQSIFTGGPWLY